MDPAPVPALGEQVILAVEVDQPVGVVEPAFLAHAGLELAVGPLAGREMELGAELLPVEVGRGGSRAACPIAAAPARLPRRGEHRQHQRDAHTG